MKNKQVPQPGYNPQRPFMYQQHVDNGRNFQRDQPYHIGVGGSGPGMRTMQHQPQQPPTPPQPDQKPPPQHIHHLQQHQPQPGSQIVYQSHMIRPAAPQPMTYRAGAVPTRSPGPRIMVNTVPNSPAFIPNQQVPYSGSVNMQQSYMMPPFMPTSQNRFAYSLQNQYANQFPGIVYTTLRPTMGNSMLMQPQPQQGTGMNVAGTVMPQPAEPPMGSQPRRKARTNAIPIIDPKDGHDVLEALRKEENTPPGSGESSARETPQLNTDNKVASEFARKVASTLGDDAIRPGSRSSSYSESEPQSVPDVQHGPPRDSIASPKIEPEMVMVPTEPALVEGGGVVPRWAPHMPMPVPMEHMAVTMQQPPPLMLLPHHEEVMRQHPPHRDFQGWPPQDAGHGQHPPPLGAGMQLPPTALNAAPPSLPLQPTVLKKPEQTTPVVSALSGPEMDNIHRDYPSLSGQRHPMHQSPGRGKRQMQSRPPRPEPEVLQPPPLMTTAPPPLMSAPPPVVSIPPHMNVPPPQVMIEAQKMPSPQPEPAPAAPIVEEPIAQKTQNTQPPPPEPVKPAPVPTSAPSEAKSNHKSKLNKRQQQRQEQQQQRQATPPPRATTPVVATAVTTPAPPPVTAAPVPEPAPEPVKPVQPTIAPIAPSVAPPAALPTPAPTPIAAPTPAAPRDPTPPLPAVTQVVDVQDKMAGLKISKAEKTEMNEEQREVRLVAAMNDENDKLTASKKIVENNVGVKAAGPESTPTPQDADNNNMTKVEVVVESPPTPQSATIIENVKPAIKYQYKKDQWSPENPAGKKHYDREFIMQLQNEPQSKLKPDDLPILEVLKENRRDGRDGGPRGGGGQMHHHRMDSVLMPSYMSKSSSLRGTGGGGGPRDQNQLQRSSLMGKQKTAKPQPIQVSLSLNEEVKLRECDTPWKAGRGTVSTDLTEEDLKTEVLYKKVRGVLNRLTPQKFQKLVAQVRALPIDTYARLEGVINLVFEKAVDEPGFSTAYAEMCNELGKMSVLENPEEDKDKPEDQKRKANLRALLVQRCQKEFEKSSDEEVNREDRLKEIEAVENPEKKKELTLQLEEDERKVRVKSVGNIRFIGELYKLRQLTSMIMFSCVEHLLKLNSEESLECLCKLLTTIGRALEEDTLKYKDSINSQIRALQSQKELKKEEVSKLQQMINQVNSLPDLHSKCFVRLEEIVRNRKTSSRVRFMIQDLIDLKRGGWVPKRDEGPKTMDQIAKEAEREQMETSLALSVASFDNKRGGGGQRQDSRSLMDNRDRDRGGRRGQDSNGGWQQVSSSNTRKTYVETSKLRLNPMDLGSADGVSLGSRNQYIWKTGSANNSEEKKAPVGGFSQNKFALLEDKQQPQLQQQQQQPSRSSSLKGPMPSTPERPLRSTPPADDIRASRSIQALRSDSGPRSRDSSRGPSDGPAPLSDNALETAVRILIDDFCNDKDLEDASKTLDEKFAKSIRSNMVCTVFQHSLEKSESVRRNTGRLLAHFMRTGGILEADFSTGLKDFLEISDDLVVDIPKLWEYLGEIMADGIELRIVLECLRPPSPGAARVIASILRIILKERPSCPSLTTASSLLLTYFGPQPYQDFIKTHKLESLANAQPAQSSAMIDDSRIEAGLSQLLRDSDYDATVDWVAKTVGPVCSQPGFIRTLTNAVLDSCLTHKLDTWKVDKDTLNKRTKLLSRYIDNNAQNELQCLFTIQAKLVTLEHPKSVLFDVCQTLQEHGVISNESFKAWRVNKDPNYMQGHGVCILGLASFFNLMDVDEDES